MNHPDPKKHQLISFAKSAIRIFASVAGGLAAIGGTIEVAVLVIAIGYGVAEIVGVYEELV